MTSRSSHSEGYLVVEECRGMARSEQVSREYQGIDRVPVWPPEDEAERDAMDDYVFSGKIKDDTTGFIPTLSAANNLCKRLGVSGRTFEVIFCSTKTDPAIEPDAGAFFESLGFDVATVPGDYWSIVCDQPSSKWAEEVLASTNEHGLIISRERAEWYLQQYRENEEPDADAPLRVFHVFSVTEDRRD